MIHEIMDTDAGVTLEKATEPQQLLYVPVYVLCHFRAGICLQINLCSMKKNDFISGSAFNRLTKL